MRAVLVRLAGFTGAPILSALAPFILLPVISRLVGAEGWADFSTGQSIGILGMVVVQFGWGIVGPVRIATTTDPDARAHILRESLYTRSLTAIVGIAGAGVATALITGPDFKLESVAMAIAMTLGGLSPAWFCIGSAKPVDLMLYDAVPKLGAALVSLPVLLLGGPLVFYPVLLGTLTLAAAVAHARAVLRHRPHERLPLGAVFAVLRGLLPTAAIDAAGNAYGSTPVPIATAGLPASEASSFASADRLYRVGVLAVIALGNAFQAWVLEPRETHDLKRHSAAIASHAVLGAMGAIILTVAGPWASGFIFGAAVAADTLTCALFGLAFLCLSTATPLIRNVLIPHGRYRFVLATTLTASAVGLAVMGIGAANANEAVIALGVAAAELTSLSILAGPAASTLRRSMRLHASLERAEGVSDPQ